MALAVTAAAGGCSVGSPATGPVEGVLRVHERGGEGGLDAVVGGTVEVDLQAGCVWVGDPQGARHPVVWPRGTTSSKDPFEVRLPDGTRVAPGDVVSGSGGYVGASGGGWDPFPAECVQTGTAAVFNPDADVTVERGAKATEGATLRERFRIPESVGLTLVAVAPNERSVATIDMVTGTVHVYEPGMYESPPGIDGAAGGGGFTHLWAQGTVYSYAGFESDPVVYEPQDLRLDPGTAPRLTVLSAPDGERTWLVQLGTDTAPTLLELVDLVEEGLTRLATVEVAGEFRPVGVTSGGVVMVSADRSARTVVVTADGSVSGGVDGVPLAVGWSAAAILRPDGALQLVDPLLRPGAVVPPPDSGEWVSVAGPGVPTTSPPSVTGTAGSSGGGAFVIGQRSEDSEKTTLVLVSSDGDTVPLFDTGGSPFVTWSRDGGWIAIVERGNVTLVSVEAGEASSLGHLVPEGFHVLTGA